jgi:hypothetical protein
VHNENNCRLIFLEISYKYQQRHMMRSQLHFNPHLSILGHADKRSGTPLEGVVTGLASIITKHNHNNKNKNLIISQVMDSEVTKSSVHFGSLLSRKIF